MHTILQKRLKEKIKKSDYNVSKVERLAGLKPSTLANIIRGKSLKPRSDTLQAVAKVLECTVDELLQEPISEKRLGELEFNLPESKSSKDTALNWNYILYLKALQIVQELLISMKAKLDGHKTMFIIQEVYKYSLFHPEGEIDVRFAKWLIRNNAP